MLSSIAKFILKIWGWKIKGDYPHHSPKKIIIAAPHTSNWDFPIGILLRNAWKAEINFCGKKSLFRWPFGIFFRAMGGVPVDRSKSNNFVDAVVQIYNEREKFTLNIAPEGTRKKVEKFKTGFYYIALNAKVPIYMVRFDWGNKELVISDAIIPTGDIESDMKMIYKYFAGTKGRNPEDSFLLTE